jgi:hypothetical protein
METKAAGHGASKHTICATGDIKVDLSALLGVESFGGETNRGSL